MTAGEGTRTRTLQLVRHAKSSWTDPSLPDLDRPLSARGERAAVALAEHLARGDKRPDVVVCSPAQRARQTLAALQRTLGRGVGVRIEPIVYGGAPDELLEVLRGLPPTAGTAMVIGHNPTIQDLALLLEGGGDRDELGRLRAKFPTAALATFVVPDPWDRLTAGSARLASLWTPR
ncbi:MAG: SixA phosphatase family protein [Acidimicrobiales bacterium]